MSKLYVSNKNESARIFKSDFLEIFTHVHWSVPIIVFFPVVVYCLVRTYNEQVVGLYEAIALFLFGLLIWTLAEYLLHRFVFHYEPKTGWGKRLHFMMHGVHHDYPSDSKRLVMVPSVSLPLAALFFGLFYLLAGPYHVLPFFAGFIFGYICYDEIHYATHHAPLKGGLGLWLKHHHVLHHYRNPDRGYGVSSPLWDYVFGTMEETEERKTAEASIPSRK